MNIKIKKYLVLLLISMLFTCTNNQEVITVNINNMDFEIEIMRTQKQKAKGLMNRKKLAENAGMLFVYESDQKVSFWMKNTLIPLSIAFISKSGEIKEIHQMKPMSMKTVNSSNSVRYALEVNQGVFKKYILLLVIK